ncbi:MAG: type II toxin-antitoxin system Phd/YefM family antitoxin [Phycisphaerae bacterium]|nr:type II toxin-antitoxin system Phd/YefM family antitoxin [Phycisphaerae bacterium]NUQ44807.1 type II toxin-antitoxin system Phd/YefM family antitoxin [Phycisphaerae bacterium]
MEIVSAADFQRKIGVYQDRALVEPVLVTRNGRERVVLISADEFHRLKGLERQSLHPSELDAKTLDAISAARVPREYVHLDDELTR